MSVIPSRPDRPSPFVDLVLAAPFPLALGALLSDWAYFRTYQIQWLNFADWLVAGSLAFGGLALFAMAVRMTIRHRWTSRPDVLAAVALGAFFVLQMVNALTHSKDAYATMPGGLVLSLFAAILAVTAAFLGLSLKGRGGAG